MELWECEIMNDVSWMGLALERKESLDKIFDKVSDLIYRLQLDDADLEIDLMDKLGEIYDLANEDAKW